MTETAWRKLDRKTEILTEVIECEDNKNFFDSQYEDKRVLIHDHSDVKTAYAPRPNETPRVLIVSLYGQSARFYVWIEQSDGDWHCDYVPRTLKTAKWYAESHVRG